MACLSSAWCLTLVGLGVEAHWRAHKYQNHNHKWTKQQPPKQQPPTNHQPSLHYHSPPMATTLTTNKLATTIFCHPTQYPSPKLSTLHITSHLLEHNPTNPHGFVHDSTSNPRSQESFVQHTSACAFQFCLTAQRVCEVCTAGHIRDIVTMHTLARSAPRVPIAAAHSTTSVPWRRSSPGCVVAAGVRGGSRPTLTG